MNHPWSAAYASFTRRALARLIDLGVVIVPCGVLYFVNRGLGSPVRYTSLFNWVWPESPTMFMATDFPGIFVTFISIKLFIAFPYFVLLESSAWQGTLGKRATGIKVTTLEGERVSFGRAAGRFFFKIVSASLFMSGYLVSFSDQRQTWHDYISKTLVLRKNVWPQFYVLPRIYSGWMFDVPALPRRERTSRVETSGYVCISCNYESSEKHSGCPACGRPYGYVDVAVLRGLGRMNGIIFLVIGCFLAYVTFWVISDRLVDYGLGRDGTPLGVIVLIVLGTATCLAFGLAAMFGRRWPLRFLLTVGIGLSRR
jgi:uncharacterized RDD family membrane protein YckC